MFQIIPRLNLLKAGEFEERIKQITLRGYLGEPPVAVTGEFKAGFDRGALRPLSIGEITHIACPTRREIYMGHVLRKRGATTWGRISGDIVDTFIGEAVDKYAPDASVKRVRLYDSLVKRSDRYTRDFSRRRRVLITQLGSHRTRPEKPEEDPQLLLGTLARTLRHELVMLKAGKLLSRRDGKKPLVQRKVALSPQPHILGISRPATPDFIIPELSAVGDIKAGFAFQEYYPLTAAGYALAYENQHGQGHDIDFGVIYFLPTREREISFAQIYVFVIDDALRKEFLSARDRALLVLRDGLQDRNNAPPFVDRNKFCIHCKFCADCDAMRGTT